MPGRLTLTAGDRLREVDRRVMWDRLRAADRRVMWAVTDGLAATAERLRGSDPRGAAAAAADRMRRRAADTAVRARGIDRRTVVWAVVGVLAFAVPFGANALRGEAAPVTRATVLEPPALAAAPKLHGCSPCPAPRPPRPAPPPQPSVRAPARPRSRWPRPRRPRSPRPPRPRLRRRPGARAADLRLRRMSLPVDIRAARLPRPSGALVAGLAALAVAGAGGWWLGGSSRSAAPVVVPASVAVVGDLRLELDPDWAAADAAPRVAGAQAFAPAPRLAARALLVSGPPADTTLVPAALRSELPENLPAPRKAELGTLAAWSTARSAPEGACSR